jgi:hypothetical protein
MAKATTYLTAGDNASVPGIESKTQTLGSAEMRGRRCAL